ncbi:capsular polysaccharide biosynthesis protein [Pseudoalteromonas sp. A25]|uniref:polysaccharide biosynthesis/export family protein n=1 Tax=Pseudoalteromonas sp. A25 TaxID=116092 RepID=UPI00126040D6|nr:polysaccharide biosynthesis/export family protein [Pseudoalteromonas sp. A25]BBN82616.1 capsular polysaccharide biosynthesis protein [Pseudoalteromonas sp. A25]
MKYKVFLILSLLLTFGSAYASESVYRLGPGDKVIIKVFGHQDLELETQLTDSGSINYPFLGVVSLNNLTIKEAEKLIYDGLKGDYLVQPNVFVGIQEYRPFYIHGEVKKPGGYPYQPGMTVNQAVALAGGLTERASREKIFISREGSKSEKELGSLAARIKAGDTITIEQRFF